MQLDENTLLAEQLARTIAHFWRFGRHKGSFQGIKQSEFMLLLNLAHLTGNSTSGIRVSDLSTQLQITSVAVSQMVKSLEENGYVERSADPTDRRVVLVKLTLKGETLVKEAHAKRMKHLSFLVNSLGEKNTKELIRLLSLVHDFSAEWHDIQS